MTYMDLDKAKQLWEYLTGGWDGNRRGGTCYNPIVHIKAIRAANTWIPCEEAHELSDQQQKGR
jgi:hypothetical protein